MKIIIDISDDDYEFVKEQVDTGYCNNVRQINNRLYHFVANGTVLPKKHGKIIDVDQFYKAFNEYLSECKSFSFVDLETILNVLTPPILKQDKESEE